jgi:hypothetical protein
MGDDMTARDVIAKALGEMIGENHTDRGLEHMAGKAIAALLSAPESVRMELAAKLNPWRAIETAPKDEDGDELLLFGPPARIACGWFVVPDSGNAGYAWDCDGQPTHWLPLPTPPSEDK